MAIKKGEWIAINFYWEKCSCATLKTTSAHFKFWMWSSYLWNIFIWNCKNVFYYFRKDGHSLKENKIKQNVRALGIQPYIQVWKKRNKNKRTSNLIDSIHERNNINVRKRESNQNKSSAKNNNEFHLTSECANTTTKNLRIFLLYLCWKQKTH